MKWFDGGHCTGMPEYWYTWAKWYMWKKVYIGDFCKQHDDNCSTKVFLTCLKKKYIVGRYVITLVAATVCLIRYMKV